MAWKYQNRASAEPKVVDVKSDTHFVGPYISLNLFIDATKNCSIFLETSKIFVLK